VRRFLTSPFFLVAALAVVIALLPVFLLSNFYMRIAALVFINALAVLGLNLLMGFAGQVSLGHAGFFGIGAYAVALGPVYLGLPSWASLLGGTAVSALLAFIVGRPILRLSGYYLAIATLGMGMLVGMVVSNEANITGGPNGMEVGRLVLFGWRLSSPVSWYWISGVSLVIGALIVTNLINSPTGRALRSIHDSEIAARVLGIDVARYKLFAFVFSAIFTSIAGSYLVLLDGFVTPNTASFLLSIEFVVMAVLGGLGSILGSFIGAAILVILPQALTVFHAYEHVVLGAIIVVFLIFLPAGIVPAVASLLRRKLA
jgi:branched-chain amino acid transport system permease protein